MKRKALFLFLVSCLAVPCLAKETVDLNRLKSSLDRLKTYEYAGNHGVNLEWVERQIGMAAVDEAVSDEIEKAILESISEATTNDAKQFLCRQLFVMGTKRSVPLLANLLTDPDMSHMACYALKGIDHEASEKTLQRALRKTSGTLQAGIINTLSQKSYAPAAKTIRRRIDDPSDDVALAAIKATGRFGGEKSLKALQKERPRVEEPRKTEVDAAILACARDLQSQGNEDGARAIYEDFYRGDYPGHLRVAGLRCLLSMDETDSDPLLVEAIESGQPDLRCCAIDILSHIKGKKTTEKLIGFAKTLPPDGKELVVRVLSVRGDSIAEPQIIEMTESAAQNVRLAALEALGDIGSSAAIPALAEAGSRGEDKETRTARASLVRLEGRDINQALVKILSSSDAGTRKEILWSLGERKANETFAVLDQYAKTEDDDGAREEAILAMGKAGGEADMAALLDLALHPRASEDRAHVKKALLTLYQSVTDRDTQANAIVAVLDGAPDEALELLLGLLAVPATESSLETVKSYLTSSEKIARKAAIRTLLDWPNASPAEDLYKIASGGADEVESVLAIRGFVRMALLSDDPTSMLTRALDITSRQDEIKSILGALGKTMSLDSLDVVEPYMDMDAYKVEANLAAVQIATRLYWGDRMRTDPILKTIAEKGPTESIRNEAEKGLKDAEKFRTHVMAWRGTGPYKLEGIFDGLNVHGTTFPPEEDPDRDDIQWLPVQVIVENDRIDLQPTFGNIDYCTAYLRTTVISPKDQEVKFRWDVDDYIKGWCNGVPMEGDRLTLRKGENRLMLKVTDHAGGWLFNLRLTAPDGGPLEEIEIVGK